MARPAIPAQRTARTAAAGNLQPSHFPRMVPSLSFSAAAAAVGVQGRCAEGVARWNSTAVSQRRASAWARSRRLHFEFGRRKPVGRAVPSLRRTSTASSRGLGHGRRLDVEHARRVSAGSDCSPRGCGVVQRVRRGRVRLVRDHRVERRAGLPRVDQRRPQLGECPERLADQGRLVAELRFADACGLAIRSADDPVVGFHHRVGDERLPPDGADRENREAAVVRKLPETVGVPPGGASRVTRCGGMSPRRPSGTARRRRCSRRSSRVAELLPVQVELAADEVHDRWRKRTAPSRWTCSATPCGRLASTTRSTSTTTAPPASATTGRVSTAACGPSAVALRTYADQRRWFRIIDGRGQERRWVADQRNTPAT